MSSNYKMSLFCIFFCILIFQSCGTWHSFTLQSVQQPVYMGTVSGETDFSKIDTLRSISGFYIHEVEDETVSHGKNISVSLGGSDETIENITSTIDNALQDNAGLFIANGQLIVEVEEGISIGAVISSILATIITKESSEPGVYTKESICFDGILYRLNNQENQDEEQ